MNIVTVGVGRSIGAVWMGRNVGIDRKRGVVVDLDKLKGNCQEANHIRYWCVYFKHVNSGEKFYIAVFATMKAI